MTKEIGISSFYLDELATICSRGYNSKGAMAVGDRLEARSDWTRWVSQNVWTRPWDGFVEIVKQRYPELEDCTKVSAFIKDAKLTFEWNGQNWGII